MKNKKYKKLATIAVAAVLGAGVCHALKRWGAKKHGLEKEEDGTHLTYRFNEKPIQGRGDIHATFEDLEIGMMRLVTESEKTVPCRKESEIG